MKKKEAAEEPRPEENRTASEGSIPPKKTAALLRYLAILFGVAFLLVLLSLFIQMRDSRETISDMAEDKESVLQKVLTLQEQTETLTAENKDLNGRLAETEQRAADAEKALTARDEEISGLRAELAEKDEEGKSAQDAAALSDEIARAWELLAKLERAAAEEDHAAAQEIEKDLSPLLSRLPAEAQLRARTLLNRLRQPVQP